MLEQPDAADLLATARAALLDNLLPALPAHLHYEARMVANAMAIAGRAAGVDTAALEARIASIADGPAAFAARIRAGGYAPGTPAHAGARALLGEMVRLRCAVSAPKALGAVSAPKALGAVSAPKAPPGALSAPRTSE